MQRFEYNSEEEGDIDELFLDAAMEGNLQRIDELLMRGADVNCTNGIGSTALIHAAENGHTEVVERLLQEEDIDITSEVSESEDGIGGSALHIAAFHGYDEIVNMLLDASNENIDDHERCGYTPLHETIVNGKFSTFKLLLKRNASYEQTTEENDITPGDLNALELIMHELIERQTKTPFILIRMLVYLTRYYPVDIPESRFFDNKIFYRLVVNNINEPANLYKELLAFFKIPTEQLTRESLGGIFGDYQELSDSDSEEEVDYQYHDKLELHRDTVEANIERNFSASSSPTLIPHFRGVHFYPRYFDFAGRRLERDLADKQANGSIAREPLFCDAAHELAGVSYQLPNCDDVNDLSTLLPERTQLLAAQSQKVISAIQLMQNRKDVQPCLIKTGRERYSTRHDEFVQRYVNSYAALKKDMEKAPSVDLTKIKSKANKEKFILLKQFGFTKLPFVSTTEDDHWAFEYAFSLVCYDKQTTFRPTAKSAIQPLRPCYLPDGKPRFPYLGVVYATLHSPAELESGGSERILDLFAEDAIDTRCAAPGGHVTGGYIRAKERIFINAIDGDRVVVGLVVRVPNLSQPYQDYMNDKYGLSERAFNSFKANLLKAGPIDKKLNLRNEKQFFRTQLKIIEKVIDHQEENLLNFLAGCTQQKNIQLKMFGQTTDELIDPCVRDAKEEKAFIKQFVDLRAAKRKRDQEQSAEENEERPTKRLRRE